MNNKKTQQLRQFALLGIFVVLFGGTMLFATRVSRQAPVAPTVPQELPKAATPACSLFVVFPTNTPTPTTTPYPVCNSTCTVNSNCPSNMVCSNGLCRNPLCTNQANCICTSTTTPTQTVTPTRTPTSTPTNTPTTTPYPVCNSTCTVNSNCPSNMVCSAGRCRNPLCTSQTNCICQSTTTPTYTPSPTKSPTKTPTPTVNAGQCRVYFTLQDTPVCWVDAREVPITYTVGELPTVGGPFYMQTDWYIAAPVPGPHHYVVGTTPLVAGQTYTVVATWPGIPPGDNRTVEIHAGLNVVTANGNLLTPNCTGGIDYYWTPYVSCPSGTPTFTPTKTPTKTPTPTTSPTRTPTPTTQYVCNSVCTVNSNCPSGMVCSDGRCRNATCTGQTNCICQSTSTPTYTPTTSPSYTPTATPLLACQRIEAFRGSVNITDNLRSIRYGETITFIGYASSSQTVKSLTFRLKINGVTISETPVTAVYDNGVWIARYVYTFNTYGTVNISVSAINL